MQSAYKGSDECFLVKVILLHKHLRRQCVCKVLHSFISQEPYGILYCTQVCSPTTKHYVSGFKLVCVSTYLVFWLKAGLAMSVLHVSLFRRSSLFSPSSHQFLYHPTTDNVISFVLHHSLKNIC